MFKKKKDEMCIKPNKWPEKCTCVFPNDVYEGNKDGKNDFAFTCI